MQVIMTVIRTGVPDMAELLPHFFLVLFVEGSGRFLSLHGVKLITAGRGI